MIKNYLKIAYRSILNNKAFSFLNIAGLSLSMAICLVLIMLVSDQMSYDRYNTDIDRIYRVSYDNLNEDGMFTQVATCPPMVGKTLLDEYAGVEKIARLRGFNYGHFVVDFKKGLFKLIFRILKDHTYNQF